MTFWMNSRVSGNIAPVSSTFSLRIGVSSFNRARIRNHARLKEDAPILKENEDDIGAIFPDTREFIQNVMGQDAYKRPSELRGD